MVLERHWPLARDVISFAVGVVLVIAQLNATPKDPTMLALGAGLMGVPAMLGAKRGDR